METRYIFINFRLDQCAPLKLTLWEYSTIILSTWLIIIIITIIIIIIIIYYH